MGGDYVRCKDRDFSGGGKRTGRTFAGFVPGCGCEAAGPCGNGGGALEKRAGDMAADYRLEFHRSKRAESDRRLREVLVGIKKKRRERTAKEAA